MAFQLSHVSKTLGISGLRLGHMSKFTFTQGFTVEEYYFKMCYNCLHCGTFVLMMHDVLHSFMLHLLKVVKL